MKSKKIRSRDFSPVKNMNKRSRDFSPVKKEFGMRKVVYNFKDGTKVPTPEKTKEHRHES